MSNSFTVPDSIVSVVTFWGWYSAGDGDTADIPSTVDWLITTDPLGGTTMAFGTASLTATLESTISLTSNGFNIYQNSFFMNVPLTAGTYWLQLQNATDQADNGGAIYWDENDGPSQAWDLADGELTSDANGCTVLSGHCSEAFSLSGSDLTTPEPGSLVLFSSGLLCLAGVLRRKLG